VRAYISSVVHKLGMKDRHEALSVFRDASNA
jgi:DNA-binding NarL/FixJ family response regulator